MSNNDLKQNILKNIEEKKITPTSPWNYRAREGAVWLIILLLIVTASVVMSWVIYDVQWQWHVRKLLKESPEMRPLVQYSVLMILAIIPLVLAIIAAISYKITSRGYRRQKRITTVIVIVLIVAGAVSMVTADAPQQIDQASYHIVPLKMEGKREHLRGHGIPKGAFIGVLQESEEGMQLHVPQQQTIMLHIEEKPAKELQEKSCVIVIGKREKDSINVKDIIPAIAPSGKIHPLCKFVTQY